MWELLWIAAFVVGPLTAAPTSRESLLLILVDGVRADYLDDPSLPLKGFRRLADGGVRAEFVTPVFPANSYPNWYSIVTGLYSESHGMVQNFMYDATRDDYFLMSPHPNASHPHWWNGAEPLWVTAEKSRIKTAMYWWDGCQVEIRGRKPHACIEYRPFNEWPTVNNDTQEALAEGLDKLQTEGFGLVMVYYESVDANGHKYGPNSVERRQALLDIDAILDKLLDEITARKLDDKVNVVVVSDHGMTVTDPEQCTLVTLDDALDLNDLQLVLGAGSLSLVLPVEGKEKKVYEDLKKANLPGLNIFEKHNIPMEYHYRTNPLIFPILIVADKGYLIEPIKDETKMKPYFNKTSKGGHGYDPYVFPDMRAIFYATGPSFKKGHVSRPVEMVDHYNVMCEVLGISPLPNNGSWERVKDMLKSASKPLLSSTWSFIIPFIIISFTDVLKASLVLL